MRNKIAFFLCVILWKYTVATADAPYGTSHELYPETALAYTGGASSGQGWNSGQSAGSYYHYHVPLVGQNHYQPVQPQPQSNDLHQTLLWLLPLLLLGLGPLLLLPLLLKFLLIPAGIGLLGLLVPLLMMGGMMMMMMMGGDMMMMPMRNRHQVTTARTLGQLLFSDWNTLALTASRSVDFDKCPEKVACTVGSYLSSSDKSSDNGEKILQYIVDQLPRGKFKKLLRKYEQAFWSGSKSGDCSNFTCQPALRTPQDSFNGTTHTYTNLNTTVGSSAEIIKENRQDIVAEP